MIINKSNNYKGRTPGATGKLQRETRELIHAFIDSKIEDINTIFNELTASEKMNAIIKLSRYILPTLRTIEILEEPNEPKQIDLSLWETKDIELLIELKDKYKADEL